MLDAYLDGKTERIDVLMESISYPWQKAGLSGDI